MEPAQQTIDPDAGYNPDFYAKSGVYLSGRAHWSTLGGDFDGDTLLASGSDVIAVPDANDGYGYELALGWMSEGWAMELSYTSIVYEGSIGAADSDVDYGAITWNGMRYLRANEPIQPYLMIGFLFSWAELEDASTDGATTGDAELDYGFGIDGGVGLAWWLSHDLALDLRALAVYQEFDEAEGVSASGTIDDPIEGPSYGISLGLTWVLGKTGGDP
jgi:opacity protein-like surface antigen